MIKKEQCKVKIIVFEGTDASGKHSQSEYLLNYLLKKGHKVKKLSFPEYESESGSIINDYLQGKESFGNNPYTIGELYSVNRYRKFLDIKNILSDIDYLIIDRYVGSNFIHQCSKIEDMKDRKKFIYHFLNYEYNELSLPVPDVEIFLNMPRKFADELMKNRGRSDIHENDLSYMDRCYKTSLSVAKMLNWEEICCVKDNQIKTQDSIALEILDMLKSKDLI